MHLLPNAAPTRATEKLYLQGMGEPIRFSSELIVHN
jgi:hypothetical protein